MIPPAAYREDVRCWKSQDDQKAPLAHGSVVKNTGVTLTSKPYQRPLPQGRRSSGELYDGTPAEQELINSALANARDYER